MSATSNQNDNTYTYVYIKKSSITVLPTHVYINKLSDVTNTLVLSIKQIPIKNSNTREMIEFNFIDHNILIATINGYSSHV